MKVITAFTLIGLFNLLLWVLIILAITFLTGCSITPDKDAVYKWWYYERRHEPIERYECVILNTNEY